MAPIASGITPGWSCKINTDSLVIAKFEQQLGSRAVLEVHHPAADQLEGRILQFGKIEGKRKLALEPWFYRMPIGRNHVDRIRTRHGRHMQIEQLRQSLLASRMPHPQSRRGNDQHKRSRDRDQPRHPGKCPDRFAIRLELF